MASGRCTAYTPCGGRSFRGDASSRLSVGKPSPWPRPSPQITRPRTSTAGQGRRHARARSPCAIARRIAVDEIGRPVAAEDRRERPRPETRRGARSCAATRRLPRPPRPNPWSCPMISSRILNRADRAPVDELLRGERASVRRERDEREIIDARLRRAPRASRPTSVRSGGAADGFTTSSGCGSKCQPESRAQSAVRSSRGRGRDARRRTCRRCTTAPSWPSR